ncbi:hypothetical protein IW150_003156, partial [Coemansia sp. RSA 2607]
RAASSRLSLHLLLKSASRRLSRRSLKRWSKRRSRLSRRSAAARPRWSILATDAAADATRAVADARSKLSPRRLRSRLRSRSRRSAAA